MTEISKAEQEWSDRECDEFEISREYGLEAIRSRMASCPESKTLKRELLRNLAKIDIEARIHRAGMEQSAEQMPVISYWDGLPTFNADRDLFVDLIRYEFGC